MGMFQPSPWHGHYLRARPRFAPSAVSDVTAPSVSSATINSAGTSITFAMSETVSIGAGGNGGFALTMSGGAVTASYSSGSGSGSLVYTLSRTVTSGETGTHAYTQPGNGVEDTAGNDLVTYSGAAVTNNSTAGSGFKSMMLMGVG